MVYGRLSPRASACAVAVLWALCVFGGGVFNMIWPGYGIHFLRMLSSVYSGYDLLPNFFSVMTATLYAFVDGFVLGGLFAWFYNGVCALTEMEEAKEAREAKK